MQHDVWHFRKEIDKGLVLDRAFGLLQMGCNKVAMRGESLFYGSLPDPRRYGSLHRKASKFRRATIVAVTYHKRRPVQPCGDNDGRFARSQKQRSACSVGGRRRH